MSKVVSSFLTILFFTAGLFGQATLQVDPTTVDFMEVELLSDSVFGLRVTNEGTDDLIISELNITGNNAAQFSLFNPLPLPITVNPSNTRTIELQFAPATTGSKSAFLEILSNDQFSDTLEVPLIGVGIASTIAVTPSPLSFDSVVVGGSSTLSVEISNLGNNTLIVNDTSIVGDNADAFAIVSSPALPISIEPGGNPVTLDIRFAPLLAGTNSSFMILTSNDPANPALAVTLDGIGVFPELETSATELDFGETVVGVGKTLTFDIFNSGIGELIISDTDIVGSDADNFRLDGFPPTPVILERGIDTLTVSVQFDPDSNGVRDAFLLLTSNDPDENPLTVSLTGIGVKPDIASNPEALDFGRVIVGEDSTMSLLVRNDGDADLIISDTTWSGDNIDQFTVLNMPTLPFTIPENGDSVVISIQFVPTSQGLKDATLSFVNNDVFRTPYAVPISGEGVVPDIAGNPNPLAFGEVEVTFSATRMIQIRNDGGAALVIDDTLFAGPNFDQFALDSLPELPIVIEPDSDPVDILVRFSPTSEGDKTAALQLFSNDPDENPFSIDLAGTGIQPRIAVSPDTVDFGNIRIETDSTLLLDILNEGTASLFISDTSFRGQDDRFFRLVNAPSLPIQIRPGAESFPLRIQFSPEELREYEADFILGSNDPDNPSLTVPLRGIGALPDIDTVEDTLHFGDVILTTDSVSFLQILNTGGVDLLVTDVALLNSPAQFSIADTTAVPLTVAPGDTGLVGIVFSPDSLGGDTATVRILSDDPDETQITRTVTGNGVLPIIAVEADTVNFGIVEIGGDSTISVFVSNSGSAALRISDVVSEGPNSNQFALADTSILPIVIPVGGAPFPVPLRFKPLFKSSKQATLSLVSNDPFNASLPIEVFGRAVAAPSVESLQFSNILLGQDVAVTATFAADTTIRSAVLRYLTADGRTALGSNAFLLGTDSVYTAMIPGSAVTTDGLQLDILVTDNFPTSASSLFYPEITIPTGALSHTFESSEQNRWIMFSLPYPPVIEGDRSISSVLEDLGSDGDFSWRIFRTDSSGLNSNYLDKTALDLAGSYGRFEPGNAFWLYLRNDEGGQIASSVIDFADTKTLAADSFTYTLQPGWNQIGLPYAFDMTWGQVGATDKSMLQVYSWNGTAWTDQLQKSGWTPLLQNNFVMTPWDGYVVRNLTGQPMDIVFRPQEADTLLGKSALNKIADYRNWRLPLVIENELNFDVVVAGMDEKSIDGIDLNDYPHPAKNDGRHVQLWFENEDSNFGQRYSSDVRAASPEGHTWYLTVDSDLATATISFPELAQLPAGFMAELIDTKYRQTYPVTASTRIRVRNIAAGEPKRFALMVGTAAFLGREADNIEILAPQTSLLLSNYPNPFNPTTQMRYQLADDGRVNLIVYDILGRKVRTLVNKYQPAGFYELQWNGKNDAGNETASGIYIYRLEINDYVESRRMLKLK